MVLTASGWSQSQIENSLIRIINAFWSVLRSGSHICLQPWINKIQDKVLFGLSNTSSEFDSNFSNLDCIEFLHYHLVIHLEKVDIEMMKRFLQSMKLINLVEISLIGKLRATSCNTFSICYKINKDTQ